MTERRFHCTACGKCCFGWLPLTVKDALAHAGRFPLAVVWSPVKPASRAFQLTARLGLTLKTRDRKQIAVRIAPTAYLPPTFSCPELTPENLCAIHAEKPSRCRSMPFFPYREEGDQADLLVPRPGWSCDISAAAPVVYRDKAIVERADFDAEKAELLGQAPILRSYGEHLLATVSGLAEAIEAMARKPGSGHVALGFASLLRRLPDVDRGAVARAQLAVLTNYATRTAGQPPLAEYHRHYGDWAWEMERLADGSQ